MSSNKLSKKIIFDQQIRLKGFVKSSSTCLKVLYHTKFHKSLSKQKFLEIKHKNERYINKMEKNRIPILEDFALISNIIPYYGPTHKGFLLLSRL